MLTPASSHRPDVDGLRMVAICSVVAYHVGIPGLPGGFVGVDVFFVISGYLITQLLVEEIAARGTIDLVGFYARRARRLMPAFVLVTGVTLLLGALFLLPIQGELAALARSAVQAALYISNFLFARTGGGYFDSPMELYPLLHTWSLAVEEQFYLLWPVLLILAAGAARALRIGFRKAGITLLVAIAVASFAYSVWASLAQGRVAEAAFYLIWSRAWELAAGAFLALLSGSVRVGSRRHAEVLGWFGLAAVFAAIIAYDGNMPYPGAAAILPTGGTVALLLAGRLAPENTVSRLLSTTPATAIGLISYGWYLWHWPLLAIARSYAGGERSLPRDGMLALVALGLAWVTYHLIENPIRRRRYLAGWSNGRTVATAIAGSAAIIIAAGGLNAWARMRADDPHDPYVRMISAARDVNPRRSRCHQNYPYRGLVPQERCTSTAAGPAPRIIVWGDSHADHLMPLMEAVAARQGSAAMQRSMSACPPMLGVIPVRGSRYFEDCDRFNRAILAQIQDIGAANISMVVLSARWELYRNRPTLAQNDHGLVYRLVTAGAHTELEPSRALEIGLTATLDALNALGVRVIVLAPAPEQKLNVPWCLARREGSACSTPRREVDAYRAESLRVLSRVTAAAHVRLVDPISALCNDGDCPAQKNGVVLYSDDDHLSASAARGLADWFADAVKLPPASTSTLGARN